MPFSQAATVANYDFGAPVISAEVLKFRVRANQGGRITARVENHGDADLVVTVKSSKDDVTYANELGAVTVKPLTSDDFTFLVNASSDEFVSVHASGGVRGILQLRGDSILEAIKI